MEHFVCTGGCGGVSKTMGRCQSEHCLKYNQPMMPCGCSNNQHPGLITACHNCGMICKTKGGCEVEEFKRELEEGN